MVKSTKKGGRGRSGGSVTDITEAPRKMSEADYPLIEHAIELGLKHVAKVRKGLKELSLPTAQIDSLKTQYEEAQRLLRRAQGTDQSAPTKTFTFPAHVSAAVRVGVYLHLALLDKIEAQQEKQLVAHPEDTKKLIRSLETLARRLHDQLSIFDTSGVNQVQVPVVRPEPEPVAPKKDPAQVEAPLDTDGGEDEE